MLRTLHFYLKQRIPETLISNKHFHVKIIPSTYHYQYLSRQFNYGRYNAILRFSRVVHCRHSTNLLRNKRYVSKENEITSTFQISSLLQVCYALQVST